MVQDAFEQTCIIDGEIRLYIVLHGVSECVQLILNGVKNYYVPYHVKYYNIIVSNLVLCINLIYNTQSVHKKQWIAIFCETRSRYDITVRFLLLAHVAKIDM